MPDCLTRLTPSLPSFQKSPQQLHKEGTLPSRFLEEGTEAPRSHNLSKVTLLRVSGGWWLPHRSGPLRPRAYPGTSPWAGAPQVPLALELLHDFQEAIVSGRIAAEADLHLVQVGEGVFHLRGGGGSWWAAVGAEGDGWRQFSKHDQRKTRRPCAWRGLWADSKHVFHPPG